MKKFFPDLLPQFLDIRRAIGIHFPWSQIVASTRNHRLHVNQHLGDGFISIIRFNRLTGRNPDESGLNQSYRVTQGSRGGNPGLWDGTALRLPDHFQRSHTHCTFKRADTAMPFQLESMSLIESASLTESTSKKGRQCRNAGAL